MKRSFAYAGPKLWNSLPTCSSTKSPNSLKKDWKILILIFCYVIDSIVPLLKIAEIVVLVINLCIKNSV